jgi:hypothetical protein
MAQVKGLDNGYLYTKDNDYRIFRSAFTRSDVTIGSTPFITIDGVSYSIGTGNRNIQFDKTDSEMNKVATLTNLALSGEDDYYLVVGLPINQYSTQREKFKKMIMAYNECNVIFKGKKFNFSIKDVLVLPQGIGALLSLDKIDGKITIFDFGGLTIDIANIEMFCGEPQLKKYDTVNKGLQLIYPKLMTEICSQCKLTSIEASDVDDILINGIHKGGIDVPTDFLTPILHEYLDGVMIDVAPNFTDVNTKIYLTGGSAIVFEELIKKYYYPEAELIPKSQFANAIGYYKVGCQVYGQFINQREYQYNYVGRR